MSGPTDARRVAIVDLLDRVLATGVVVSGDITISLADIDLIRLDLRVLLASVAGIDAGGASTFILDQEEPSTQSGDYEALRSVPPPTLETARQS
jgi:Gas vesicle protein